jgi:uncharacterized protein YxjI
MKQKLFSWGDDFSIRDEEGRDVFLVDGKALSFGDQLTFRDPEGHELAFIRQKLCLGDQPTKSTATVSLPLL